MLVALGALSAVPAARASWMIPPTPIRPKDFTLVRKDGIYHIFYIRRDVTLPGSTERDFGHAVSADLYHWTQLDPVLTVRDSSWDNQHVWAPSILLKDGVYYMFYTGVTDIPGQYVAQQRIGVATSTDLMTWNRMDQPVFSCDQVPWTFCDTLSALPGFRDPFVMADPGTPGRDLMYYTATANLDSSSMVVGVAASDGDLTHWADLKPLWATYRTHTASGIIESPHVFQHAGLWYLFFTTGSSQPIAFLAGPDPLADPGGWPYFRHLGDVLGFNTLAWFASEYLKDGSHDYLAFVDGDRIEMYEMSWQGPAQFTLAQPDQFHVQSLAWSSDSVLAGQHVSLSIASVNWVGRSAALQAFALDSLGAETVVPLDSLGLPGAIPLTADTTRFDWTSRRWPAAGTDPMRLGLRMWDSTAVTAAPVVVLPDTTPPDTTLHVIAIQWLVSGVRPGDVAPLQITATNWSGRSVPIAAWKAKNFTSLEVPVPTDSLGLPSEIPLTGSATIYDWTARVWPATSDTTQVMWLNVGLPDGTRMTGPLRVGPDSLPPPPDTTFRVTAMAWDVQEVANGEVAPLLISAVNAAGRLAAIAAFLADSLGALTAAPLDSLGLPLEIPLDGDQTWFDWTATRWGVAAAETMRVVLRVAGDTVGTGILKVLPDSIATPPDTTFQVTSLAWKVGQVASGAVAPLEIRAVNGAGHSAAIAAFLADSVGGLTAAPLDSLGLPAAIALAGDSTVFDWTARRWGVAPAETLRVVVRLARDLLGTQVLKVLPDSIATPPDTTFRVTSLAWLVAQVKHGEVAPLRIAAVHAAGCSAAIAAFTLDASDSLRAAPLDSLGLPAAIALAGDSTVFDWTSRTWPDTAGATLSTRLIVRATAFGLETAALTVLRDSVPPPAPADPGGQDGTPPPEGGIVLRTVRGFAGVGGTEFLIELGAPAAARLDVFDVSGRRVRNLADRVLPSGASVLSWDGRDANGRRARAGVYFARLSTARAVRITRAVLLP